MTTTVVELQPNNSNSNTIISRDLMHCG